MSSHPITSAGDWARHLLELLEVPAALSASPTESAPIADWASSGAVPITGTPDQPLLPTGAGATAARGALLALDAIAGPTGIQGHHLLAERAAITRWQAQAPWSLGGHCRAVRARDAWFALSLARDSDLDLLPALTLDPSAVGWQQVHAWACTLSAADAVARCRLLGLPAGVIGETAATSLFTLQSDGAPRSRPLAGLRVVDLSSLWAGPLCANLLAHVGARVIRVESVQRPDGGRRGIPEFDDLLHAGQRSIAFAPDGLSLLHRVVDSADIVITAARPRGLASLGLDPMQFLSSRPHGVWVQLSAHGSTGEEANWIGFGDDVAMSAGLVRWIDGMPVPIADALADPLAGMHAAVAAAALATRGGAHLLDLSLGQIAAATVLPQPQADPQMVQGHWTIDTEFGTRPVSAPRARTCSQQARPFGADTAAVLAELGV